MNPVAKAQLEIFALCSVGWFIILTAGMFLFGDLSWLATGGVLIIVLIAISLLKNSHRLEKSRSSREVILIAVICILTALVTLVVAELLNPNRSIQQHFNSLLNPYWTIIGFYLLALKNTRR